MARKPLLFLNLPSNLSVKTVANITSINMTIGNEDTSVSTATTDENPIPTTKYRNGAETGRTRVYIQQFDGSLKELDVKELEVISSVDRIDLKQSRIEELKIAIIRGDFDFPPLERTPNPIQQKPKEVPYYQQMNDQFRKRYGGKRKQKGR